MGFHPMELAFPGEDRLLPRWSFSNIQNLWGSTWAISLMTWSHFCLLVKAFVKISAHMWSVGQGLTTICVLLRFMEESKVNPVGASHMAHGLAFASGNDANRGFIVLHKLNLKRPA